MNQFEIPLRRASLWFESAPQAPSPLPQEEGFLDCWVGQADVSFVAPLVRRRMSRLTRGMLHCAARVAPEPAEGLRTVFASQHGEMERTLALLEDLAAGRELSPAHFSLSVHNSAAGLWSIAKGSRGPSSAVAAGPESFAWGLLEAYAALAADPSRPVLYVYGDERLPSVLEPFDHPRVDSHALALLLDPAGSRRLRVDWDPSGRGEPPALAQSLHFLDALGGGEAREPWRGATGSWTWHVA